MRRLLVSLALLALLCSASLAQTGAPTPAQAGPHVVYLPTTRRIDPPRATTNLTVSAATYLGGTGADSANALDIAPDGTIVFGGVLPGYTPAGVSPTTLLGGSDGLILRLARDGRSILSATRIGAAVQDLEINDYGQLAVCGSFGVALLNSAASSVVWSANPGAASRCAIGNDGTVAALIGSSAVVYSAQGSPLGSWSVGGTARNDIAVDNTTGQVFITGYTQKTSTLQVAWLKAWSYGGAANWTSYDFTASQVTGQSLGADTRGERIAIGRDGKLYFAGSINGGTGASIFARDPKNITLRLGSDRNVATDSYNNPTNVGSVKMVWYGRYTPATGALEQGSSLLTRLSGGGGNSISVKSLIADESGAIFLAGDTACCLQNRNTRQVAGVTVGPYAGGEAYVLTVSADLRQRLVWTPFAGPGTASAGGSPATAVSVRAGVAAVAITYTSGGLITASPLQATPASPQDAYVAVWQP